MGAPAMLASEARVPTLLPRRYLSQLCKHFEHRLPVTLAETAGTIRFSNGLCRLAATAETLLIRLETPDPAALAMLQDVVARHLLRFAFRDPPEIRWSEPT